MKHERTRLFRIELALAACGVLTSALTLIWSDWIELVFRTEPDRGSGTLEWAIAGGGLAIATAFSLVARSQRRPHSS
jgi:hypothetical protein